MSKLQQKSPLRGLFLCSGSSYFPAPDRPAKAPPRMIADHFISDILYEDISTISSLPEIGKNHIHSKREI
jgi:hypothetical protein